MKAKSVLKYILNFLIHYVTSTAILWLLYDDKAIKIILVDALIVTCLFEFIEFIGALIKKHTGKKSSDEKDLSESNNKGEESIVALITGICFILLIVFRVIM